MRICVGFRLAPACLTRLVVRAQILTVDLSETETQTLLVLSSLTVATEDAAIHAAVTQRNAQVRGAARFFSSLFFSSFFFFFVFFFFFFVACILRL